MIKNFKMSQQQVMIYVIDLLTLRQRHYRPQKFGCLAFENAAHLFL